MQRLPDSHTRLDDAAVIARHLVDERFSGELGHLSQARVLYLRSEREVLLHGHRAAAYIARPRVQGAMSAVFEDLLAAFAGFDGYDPDFVVRIDAACWDDLAHTEPAQDFWRSQHVHAGDDVTWTIGRERLICHELLHTYHTVDAEGAPKFSDDDGRPVLALRPHEAEYFHDELRYYGPTVCGAVDTALAIAEGGRAEVQRQQKLA